MTTAHYITAHFTFVVFLAVTAFVSDRPMAFMVFMVFIMFIAFEAIIWFIALKLIVVSAPWPLNAATTNTSYCLLLRGR